MFDFAKYFLVFCSALRRKRSLMTVVSVTLVPLKSSVQGMAEALIGNANPKDQMDFKLLDEESRTHILQSCRYALLLLASTLVALLLHLGNPVMEFFHASSGMLAAYSCLCDYIFVLDCFAIGLMATIGVAGLAYHMARKMFTH